MNQKLKATALIAAAIMLLVAMPAMAATPTSNLNNATASVFSNDVDNYLNVNNFSKVTFDKNFAFAGLQNSNLNLGYATKIGSLYIGAWYAGDVANMVNGQETDVSVLTTPSVVNDVVSSTSTTTTKTLATDNPFITDNTVNVLVGVAGMGFKLGFTESLSSYVADSTAGGLTSGAAISTVTTDTADTSVASTVYSNTSKVSGYMTPSIQWGTNLTIGDMILKPNATVSVAFNQNSAGYTKDVTKTVAGSVPYGFTTTNIVSSTNNGSIEPNANLNAKLSFAKVDGGQATIGLTYEFDMPLYGDGTKVSTVQTDNTIGTADTTKTVANSVKTTATFEMTNTVTPAVYYTKDFGDQFSIGCNASAAVKIYNKKATPTTVKTTTTTYDKYSQDPADDYVQTIVETTPDDTSETTTLSVTPKINLGFIYKLVPNKLSLNGGYAIAAPIYTTSTVSKTRTAAYSKTTTTVSNGVTTNTTTATGSGVDAEDPRTETQTVTTTVSQLSGTLYFGPTFNFTDNFALDAVASLGTGGTASIIDLWGSNGILSASYSLMFTLKY